MRAGVTRPTFPAVIEALAGGIVMHSGGWVSFLLRRGRCGLLPLPNRQGAAVARLAREIHRALRARFAETRPESELMSLAFILLYWGCKDKDISVWIANSHLAISPSLIGRWKLAEGAPG